MLRKSILALGLILTLALPGTTLASPPTGMTFMIDGATTDPGETTQHGPVSRVRGLEAQGEVTGDLEGAFHYTENATVNTITLWATNQAFMTMSITNGCPDGPGTIYVRFQGRVQIDPASGVGIIADQPFTILEGEEGCEGIHGQGTRSAVVSLIPFSPFTVTYTARVHWDPQ